MKKIKTILNEIVKKKNSGIKYRIMFSMIVCIVIVTVIMAVASTVTTYVASMNTLKQSISELAKLSAKNTEKELNVYKTAVGDLADDAVFDTIPPDPERVDERFNAFKEDHEFQTIGYTDEMGISADGMNHGIDEFFSEAKLYLKPYVSNVEIIGTDATFTVSAPIIKNGEFKGVVYAVSDAKTLSTLINTNKLGSDSVSFMLNQNGDTIASKNYDEVLNQLNVMDEEKENSSYRQLADIQGKMTAATSGVGTYKDDKHIKRIVGFSPISDTEGWSIAIAAKKSEFMSGLIISVVVTLVIAVLVIVLAVILSIRIAKSLSAPISSAAERMKLLAQGDITSSVQVFDTEDETGVLTRVTEKTVNELKHIITDLSETLGEIAGGNLAIKFDTEYYGDFAPIGDAIRNIISQMNSVISNIQDFSVVVSEGAEQVSCGAQALSQGATEQASAVQELAATIEDVSRKVHANADSAAKANGEIENVNVILSESHDKMGGVVDAMKDISRSSAEIKKILETIEDIAFQTNLLSLNAAIEAVKAGAAGRGFSVVAEEVRSLAEKSSAAAKSTADLVKSTLESVSAGSNMVNDTANSLNDVVTATQAVTDNIGKITEASSEQSEAISQITNGVMQIAGVVQTNSSTAEQSAAASNDLSNQAKKLASLIDVFTVDENYETDIDEFMHNDSNDDIVLKDFSDMSELETQNEPDVQSDGDTVDYSDGKYFDDDNDVQTGDDNKYSGYDEAVEKAFLEYESGETAEEITEDNAEEKPTEDISEIRDTANEDTADDGFSDFENFEGFDDIENTVNIDDDPNFDPIDVFADESAEPEKEEIPLETPISINLDKVLSGETDSADDENIVNETNEVQEKEEAVHTDERVDIQSESEGKNGKKKSKKKRTGRKNKKTKNDIQ